MIPHESIAIYSVDHRVDALESQSVLYLAPKVWGRP